MSSAMALAARRPDKAASLLLKINTMSVRSNSSRNTQGCGIMPWQFAAPFRSRRVGAHVPTAAALENPGVQGFLGRTAAGTEIAQEAL